MAPKKEGDPPEPTRRQRKKKTSARSRPQQSRDTHDATSDGALPVNGPTAGSVHHASVHGKDTADIYADHVATLLARFKKRLQGVEFKDHPDPSSPKASRPPTVNVEDLFSISPSRGYTPVVRGWESNDSRLSSRTRDAKWILVAIPGPRDDAGERIISIFNKTICPHLTEDQILDLCRHLVDHLNRWPGSLDYASSGATPPVAPFIHGSRKTFSGLQFSFGLGVMGFIFDSIASQPPFSFVPSVKVMTMPQFMPVPPPSKTPGSHDHYAKDTIALVNLRFPFFNTASGKREMFAAQKEVRTSILEHCMPAVMPQLPPPSLGRFYPSKAKGSRTIHPQADVLVPTIPDNHGNQVHDVHIDFSKLSGAALSEANSHAGALLALYKGYMCLAAKLHGSAYTKAQLQDEFKFLEVNWLGISLVGRGNVKHTSQTWWGGPMFFQINRDRYTGTIILVPSPSLSRAVIKGKVPRIVIPSLDMARMLPVLDAAMNVLRQTNDPREALLAAAVAVEHQKENIRQGVPSSNTCSCRGNESASCMHHCSRCGAVSQGSKLVSSVDTGLGVCPICARKDAAHPDEKSIPSLRATSRMYRSFKHECEKLGIEFTSPSTSAVYEAAKVDIQSRFTGTGLGLAFKDDYRQAVCHLPLEREGGFVADPRIPSVDAIFMYALSPNFGLSLKHVSGNLAVTLQPENYGKWIWVPGVLQEVANYLAAAETEPSTTLLVKACDRFAAIAVKSKILKRYHLGSRDVLEERIALEKQEWVTGKLRDEDGPWQGLSRDPKNNIPPPAAEKSLIGKMSRLLEEEFGVAIVRSLDGCPWFGHPAFMPGTWTWGTGWGEVCIRFKCMLELCNGLDSTVDTPTTLFIECIFQACAAQCTVLRNGWWTATQKSAWRAEYSEFLKLPLLCQRWSPLNFSIAHKLHGQQMRTGWTITLVTLGDRNNDRNNILLETRFSNYFKHNYESEHYEFLKEIIRSINLSTSYYDPNGQLDDIPEHLRLQWTDAQWKNRDAIVIEFENDISAIQGTGFESELFNADESDEDDKEWSREGESSDEVIDASEEATEASEDEVISEKKKAQAEFSRKTVTKSQLRWPCPKKGCGRATKPYMHKGHLKTHLKTVHNQEISEQDLRLCSVDLGGDAPGGDASGGDAQGNARPLPVVHDRDIEAKRKLDQVFPHGWDVLPTSAAGFYCVFHAMIGSIKAQHPAIPVPNIESDLIPFLADAPEMQDARESLAVAREAADEAADKAARAADQENVYVRFPDAMDANESNNGHLLLDHATGAIYQWYQKYHGIDVATGLIRRGFGSHYRHPMLGDSSTTSDSTLIIWIECDMVRENKTEGLEPWPHGMALPMNHFSSTRAKAGPIPPRTTAPEEEDGPASAPSPPRVPETPGRGGFMAPTSSSQRRVSSKYPGLATGSTMGLTDSGAKKRPRAAIAEKDGLNRLVKPRLGKGPTLMPSRPGTPAASANPASPSPLWVKCRAIQDQVWGASPEYFLMADIAIVWVEMASAVASDDEMAVEKLLARLRAIMGWPSLGMGQ